MVEHGLTAQDNLIGFSQDLQGATLTVLPQIELLAIALPSWSRQNMHAHLGPLPHPGQGTEMDSGHALLWTGIGQYYTFGSDRFLGENTMALKLAGTGYVTDISDGWTAFEFTGPLALERLDLITLPDLTGGEFNVGAVISTVLGHLRVLIWRRATDKIVLLSASSSAQSLSHHLARDLALHDAISKRSH